MTFKELTLQRASVRSFATRQVEDEKIDYMLECARMAPSAVNFQPWHFYVVQGADARAAVQRSYDREWFKGAPLYIVCSVRHDEEWVRQLDGKPHGNIDIAIAAQHLCLAAADCGLGSCWVCNFDAPMLHDALSMAQNEEPAVIVAVGYPDGEIAGKKRKDINNIVTRL